MALGGGGVVQNAGIESSNNCIQLTSFIAAEADACRVLSGDVLSVFDVPYPSIYI